MAKVVTTISELKAKPSPTIADTIKLTNDMDRSMSSPLKRRRLNTSILSPSADSETGQHFMKPLCTKSEPISLRNTPRSRYAKQTWRKSLAPGSSPRSFLQPTFSSAQKVRTAPVVRKLPSRPATAPLVRRRVRRPSMSLLKQTLSSTKKRTKKRKAIKARALWKMNFTERKRIFSRVGTCKVFKKRRRVLKKLKDSASVFTIPNSPVRLSKTDN